MQILGISAYYHDSAAALLVDGEIVAAAQEERFSRQKHDAGFPKGAIAYCLKQAGIGLQDVDQIVFYDKPLLKFERLLETYLSYAPKGFSSFITAMPIWLKEKLYLKTLLKKELALLGECKTNQLLPLLFTSHHQAHAASAFFASPFESAAVLCLDGVGEWATTSVWSGFGHQLTPQWEIHFEARTGCAVLVNTSFNVRGEPIVCTPEDAYRCFMRTEMDYLVIENFLLAKSEQPQGNNDESWKQEFELD